MPKNQFITNDYFDANHAPTKEGAGKLFKTINVDDIAENWNQYFPYQLKIVVAGKDSGEGGNYLTTQWNYTLPISPQELTVDMPIATTVTPTLNGIVEQHGGVPFRNINIQSTTGVTPVKNRGNTIQEGPLAYIKQVANNVAGSTVQNVEGIASLSASLLGKNWDTNVNKGLSKFGVSDDYIPSTSTGFFQYMLLEQFIENYHNMKQKGDKVDTNIGMVDAKDLRLAFCIWKENAVYLVSGVQLTRRRSANNPMEYNYSLQLKAWARVSLNVLNPTAYQYQLAARDPTIVADIFNRFRAAREIISTSHNLIDSILKETAALVNEGLRQTELALEDMAGIAPTFKNFPDYIKQAGLQSILDNWETIKNQGSQIWTDLINIGKEDQEALLTTLGDMPVDLPPAGTHTKQQIKAEMDLATSMGRMDYQNIQATLIDAANQFADVIGAGDLDYHTIYDIPILSMKTRTPSDQERQALFAMAETIQVMDYLAASSLIGPQPISSLDYVAGLAEQAGTAFKKPNSKFAVPFPYGVTLEQLALRYLGDANRWLEIAVLNGLKEPYIDEEGFRVNLLVNGDRNQILVPKDNRFFIGQMIWITARYVREHRRIINIQQVNSQYLITVDGDQDLDQFTVLQEAHVEAFLPNTVNSQKTIFIPSNKPSTLDPESKQIPGVDEFDPLLEVSGTDLLLTDSYDLAITDNGDCKLAYGLANIIQSVKISLSTTRGSLLQHPTFGFSVPSGASLADIDVNTVLTAIKDTFKQDPTFVSVKATTLKLNGNTLTIALMIEVVGVDKYIPVTVQIQSQ